MIIEGGKVTVGVTKNMGDYNQKKIEVALTFQVQEGEDAESVVAAVTEMASRRAQEYIDGRPVKAVGKGLPRGTSASVSQPAGEHNSSMPYGKSLWERTKEGSKTDPGEQLRQHYQDPPGAPVETQRVMARQEDITNPPVVTPSVYAGATPERRSNLPEEPWVAKKRKPAVKRETVAFTPEAATPQEKVITDADLHSAVARKCEKVVGLAPRVRKLMQEYGATDLTKIDPQFRKPFLSDLEDLQLLDPAGGDTEW